jgi:hypothetical protein
MVAGRVCKWGVGGRLLGVSVMGTLPEIEIRTSSKRRPKPKYAVAPAEGIYRPVTKKSQAKSCNANAVREKVDIPL